MLATVNGEETGRWPLEARTDVWLFAALVVSAVVPVFAGRYLPFFDYPAHLAVPAALRHRADPSTEVSALWTLDLRLVPNSLHYAFTYLGSFLLPLETASRLFVAMCIAALPLATALFLRAFGRDWRLAVLAVPLAWNRCLWYGFIGYCAALPIALVVLALLERDLERPAGRREIGLAALMALLPFAHFFVMVVTLVLALVLVLAHARGARMTRLLRSVAPLAAGPAVMLPWFFRSLASGPSSPDAPSGAGALLSRPNPKGYAALLRHWFMDSYAGSADDLVALVMLATLAALVVRDRRAPGPADPPPAARRAPLLMAGALVLLYLALPFELRGPFHWWAMNVRVLPLLFVCLLASVAPGRLDRLGRLGLVPVAAASLAFTVFIAVDVARTFNGPWGMAGLDEVRAHIPKGARVLGLYTDYRQPPRYAHYPFHYASAYAVVESGGIAAPFIPIPQSWTNPRRVPDYPTAGDAALFRFDRHARGYSHFLVRICEGNGCVPDPLEHQPAVTRVVESGRWRLYRLRRPPEPAL